VLSPWPQYARYRRLTAELRQLEERLVDHLQEINFVLERRFKQGRR
jgi:hypothetical protein